MRNKSLILKMLIMTVITVQVSYAQFTEDALRLSQFNSSVGARSQSMGNTVVGIADDYSALFGNPAGLSMQKSYEFSAGLSSYGYGNDVLFFGNKTTDRENAVNLNNIGIVLPIATKRGGLTFAFGFGRVANFASVASFDGFNPTSSIVRSFWPYAGNTNEEYDLLNLSKEDADNLVNNHIPFSIWLADTLDDYLFPILTDSVQQTAKVIEGGGLNNWSFGGGIDIAENLSLGISLNIVSGSYTYEREFNEKGMRSGYTGNLNGFDYWTYTSTIESDIKGFNALFGMMFREEKFRIGMTLRTPTAYEINETFTDAGTSHFNDNSSYSKSSSGETKYNVITPAIISGGLSVFPNDWLLLAGDVEYTDWTDMEFDSDNPDLIDENLYIKHNMRDAWNLRGGTEITLQKLGLKLRAGMQWKESPWKNDPSKYDQWNYTAGFGYKVDERSCINASYALGSWDTFRNNYYLGSSPASRTSESVTTHSVNVTFSYKF